MTQTTETVIDRYSIRDLTRVVTEPHRSAAQERLENATPITPLQLGSRWH